MEKILVDTDVVIDFLRGYGERIQAVFTKIESGKLKGYISVVTLVELYSGEDVKKKEKEQVLLRLLSFFECIYLNDSLAKLAGKMKCQYKMALADSIIAASVKELRISLFTYNKKHFEAIEGVKIFNPS